MAVLDYPKAASVLAELLQEATAHLLLNPTLMVGQSHPTKLAQAIRSLISSAGKYYTGYYFTEVIHASAYPEGTGNGTEGGAADP